MFIKILLLFLPFSLLAQSPILESIRQAKERDCPSPAPPSAKTISHERFQAEWAFLFWETKEEGLEFAALNSTNLSNSVSAQLSSVKAAWSPAFKLLFGACLIDPFWDLNIRWTWLYSRSHKSLSQDLSKGGLFPLWTPPQANLDTPPLYSSAQAVLLMHFNAIDLELASAQTISPFFRLKLHGGVKGISIDQNFRVNYQGGAALMGSSAAYSKNECLGMGPRFGCGTEWLFFSGWSVIAELSSALALCSMDISRQDTSNEAVNLAVVFFKERFWIWRPLLEGKTGVRWEYRYGKAKQRHVRLEGLYEMQQYWEQNMFSRYTDGALFYLPFSQRGNLTLQGVSFALGLGF